MQIRGADPQGLGFTSVWPHLLTRYLFPKKIVLWAVIGTGFRICHCLSLFSAALTQYLDLDNLYRRDLFLIVLEAGKSKT